MRKYLPVLISGIASGAFLGIGVVIYLALYKINKILGALIFGMFLYGLVMFNVLLYNEKIGYVLEKKYKFIFDIILGGIGNFTGMGLFCLFMMNTSAGPKLMDIAEIVALAKLNASYLSIILHSTLCGGMIYLVVIWNKNWKTVFGRIFIFVFSSLAFVILGYGYCIGNFGYFTLSSEFDHIDTYLRLALMIVSNLVGSILMYFGIYFRNKYEIKNR